MDGQAFGGISGLTFMPDNTLLALSDAHLARGPSRMFRATVEFDPFEIEPTHAIVLGGPFESGFEDPEAIARLPTGDLLISSEGDLKKTPKLWSSLHRVTTEGKHLSVVPLPADYVQRAGFNKGIEGVAVSPSGQRIVVTTEHPLSGETDHQLLVFDGDMNVVRRLRYEIDPLPDDPRAGEVTTATIGISDLCLIDDSTLLVLERAGIAVDGVFANYVRIYQSSLTHLGPKILKLDLDTIKHRFATPLLDNFEALALGPPLPNGDQALIVASDDNFKSTQRTVFVLLALHDPGAPMDRE